MAAGQITFTLSSLNNGNCNAVSDNMTIYLTDGIIVSAGPDQSVCVASDHANLQGSIQNGSPSGTWTTTGTTIEVNDATTLRVRDSLLIGNGSRRFMRLEVTRP